MESCFGRAQSKMAKISIQSKPLYNIIERVAKINILTLFLAFDL
jgi:hypothetical protein